MTNAEMIQAFAKKLIRRVQWRMDDFGDTYEKAKSMIQLESVAGPACWAVVDAHFNK